MPPKAKGKGKGKGKGKKKVEIDPNLLTEVDKTFYELQIADLNRKLARLRSLTQELEIKNEELQQQNVTLDEDRNDIIIYLKRILQEKMDEIKELEESVTALKESMQDNTAQYEDKIADMENEYREMHEQLTSEIKLLDGKLNSLEEFRTQRDDLIKKYENQENEMEAQEKRHKREIYEIERKFIISKDQLKRDMETKLQQLSIEFQNATELRIAATTHRVIRENIAVNNELDLLLATQQRLHDENTAVRKRDTYLRQQSELHEVEKKKALTKVKVQLKIIDRVTADHKYMTEMVAKYKKYEQEIFKSRTDMKAINDKNLELQFKVKILEQNLHNVRCDRSAKSATLIYTKDENARLNSILLESVACIKEALTVGTEGDESLRVAKRENLLNSLLTLLTKARDQKIRRASVDTIDSMEATYTKGDLGFIPKPVELRSRVPTKRHMESQTGTSFEEYLAYAEAVTLMSRRSSFTDEEQPTVSEIPITEIVEEKASAVFFDESEVAAEESETSKDFNIFDFEIEEDEVKEVAAIQATVAQTQEQPEITSPESPEVGTQEAPTGEEPTEEAPTGDVPTEEAPTEEVPTEEPSGESP